MTGAPEISYCLPVFNASARIERCLRGVLAQQTPSREILLVDNASTDDTVAKARALLAGISGARIVVNDKNLGRIENWNRCLELSTGRYIKFALANDVLLPGGADMLLNAANANPGTVMVCSKQRDVDAVPDAPDSAPAIAPAQILNPVETLRRFSRNGNDTGALGGMLIDGDCVRKDALRFRTDIPFWSDFCFAIELAARGNTVYVDAASYFFDKSIKSRFALSGTGANGRSLCFEARECSILLAQLLPKHGVAPWRGFEFLHAIYSGSSWYGQLPIMSWRDTRTLFEGAGPLKTSALEYRFWQTFGHLEHPLKRIASKLGLYRYPWEKPTEA